jgi:hypothetical protein
VFIGPLPSYGCPVVESVTSGKCLLSRCLGMGIAPQYLILSLNENLTEINSDECKRRN